MFAHRYGFTCQACHTAVPHLTSFGEAFLANGYRLPGVKPKPAFPLAMRAQLAYASGGNPSSSGPLPKVIVDEVEFLIGGSVGTRGSYWTELYAVDGGVPGRARDLWAGWRATPDGARTPVTLRAGQFTLPLPLDPETFRETGDHYAIWDQTAGENPFAFFDPKLGGQIAFGSAGRALGGTISVLQGHDAGSGLPARGLDTMLSLQRTLGDFTLSGYRYDGRRTLPAADDRFARTGFGLGWQRGATRIDGVYQSGNDSAADAGGPLRSSGGFVQIRRQLSPRLFAIGRWDATQDTAFLRSVTAGLGYRVTRNTRLTVFETGKRDQTGRVVHELSSSLLLAL